MRSSGDAGGSGDDVDVTTINYFLQLNFTGLLLLYLLISIQ